MKTQFEEKQKSQLLARAQQKLLERLKEAESSGFGVVRLELTVQDGQLATFRVVIDETFK